MNKPSAEKKRRFKPEIRRTQIIETTKKLILENGLTWASSLRIAKAMGVSQQALYHPFKNKREILLATLSSITDEIVQKTMTPPQSDNIDDFIREAARTFYRMTIADPRQSRLLFEYLCAPPTEEMREEVEIIFSNMFDIAEAFVKKGIEQRRFSDDLEADIIAWIFGSLGIALNIGAILQTSKFLSEEKALRAVDVILRAITK